MRKRYFKKLVSSLLVVSMFVSSVNIVGATEENTKTIGTKKKVQSTVEVSDDTIPTENKTGYIDAGIEYDRIPDYAAFGNGGFDKATVIPASYSSVEKGYVTKVKNQNPWGTCWAHAAVAAMESYALSHGLVDNPEDINLSEFALAYLTFEDEDMLFDKTGDYSDIADLNIAFDAGGNDEMAYKALSNGLALYNDDEEQYTQSQNSFNVPEIEWDEDNISYVLTGQKYIDINDIDQVKAAVIENGAVTISYYSHNKYMNNNHLYNYNYENYGTNHAVAIVGWDDNKSKDLFTVSDGTNTYTPKNNGAWLIKNSWGTYCGDNGYIWISYEDFGVLSSDAVVYEIAPKDKYPVLYQHDGATIAYNPAYGYSFASVFEVESEKERVNALSFFTFSTQMGYTAYLYDNSNGLELDKGELIASTSGTTSYAGYYTVNFDSDNVFMQGDKFTVIIEFASLTAMLYATANASLANVGNAYSTCLEGQSYIKKYPTEGLEDVVDLGGYKNISLKAHSVPIIDEKSPTKIKEAKFIGNEQVTISWAPVENAVSYELWKSDSESGNQYKVITGITDTTYVDKTIAGSSNVMDMVKFGETYYYKVRAVYSDGSKNDYSNLKKVEIIPTKTVANVTVSDNNLKISWEKLDYADGYTIYIGSDDEENIVKVGEVAGNITSYIYDEWLYYYADYYVAVEPYVYNSQGTKICGKYDVIKISTRIKQAQMVDAHYIVEDSIYLQWEWTSGNLVDGIYIKISCNGMTAVNEMIETTATSYILDVSRFEPGDFLQIECSVYYEFDNGSCGINPFYSDSFEIGATFDSEVSWYVKDNQIYVCIPNADAPTYEIYYGYDESKVGFSNVVEVTQDEMQAGYPLPADTCPITGCRIGVRMTPDIYNQVIPKELIKVGGMYKEPLLQTVENVRATSSGMGVKLQAVITNKVEGFAYEYQWYVSDFKNGTATPISNANSAEYVAYVGDAEAKYYYCQITCKYNGIKVYTTTNENGERTRVLGKNCFDNISISDIQSQNYTGSAIKPTVIVMEDSTKLVLGTHYTVAYENNINAGTGIVKITFKGAYSSMGMKVVEFEIKPINVSTFSIGDISDQIYTGSVIKPQVSVEKGSVALVAGTDYIVEYGSNTQIGLGTVVIKGIGNYTGSITKNFNILQVPYSKLSVGSISAQIYTGQPIVPAILVKYGSYTLVEGTDYEVSYSNNVKVGTATVTITLKGNYSGQLTKTFSITGKSIASAAISQINDYVYTGAAITPTVTVKDGNKTLAFGVDYTISYSSNINAGNAKLVITGKGNYAGTQTKNFTIIPMSCEGFAVSNISNYNYSGAYITPTVTVKNGNVNLTNGTDYTVAYANNINVGTANVTITFKGNYQGILGAIFEIKPKTIENISLGTISDQMYTGSALTPSVVAKDGSYTLVNGKDYTLAYSNNINNGIATVTLTGKGNYTGIKKTTFTIKSVPEKITSSSVTVTDKTNSISKITSGTTVGSFVSKLNENKYVSVYKENAKVENTALIGTGMTACIMDGNKTIKKYTVIVTGDTSGDGKINITDMIAVKANILKKTLLTGVYSKAGDVNGDSKINITDFIKIKATLLGKDSISGVAVQ